MLRICKIQTDSRIVRQFRTKLIWKLRIKVKRNNIKLIIDKVDNYLLVKRRMCTNKISGLNVPVCVRKMYSSARQRISESQFAYRPDNELSYTIKLVTVFATYQLKISHCFPDIAVTTGTFSFIDGIRFTYILIPKFKRALDFYCLSWNYKKSFTASETVKSRYSFLTFLTALQAPFFTCPTSSNQPKS